MDQLKLYPSNSREGMVPLHLLDEKMEGNLKNLEESIIEKIRQEF
jgi:hypothetical protein